MFEDLSEKQIQILNFLKEQIASKGYPPAVREICKAVNLKSTSTVHSHLKKLEQKGYIRKDPTKPRAIEVLSKQSDDDLAPRHEVVHVPIIGKVTAGQPILAIENIEDTFPIPAEMIGREPVFMLNVWGDSMVNAGIIDGDCILVKKQDIAQNGDIVVALIEDEATVKRFFKEDGYYRLQPENDAYEPIIVDSVRILGKVAGVFRKL